MAWEWSVGVRGSLHALVGNWTNSGFMVRGESRMRPFLDYMNCPEAHCNNPGVGRCCCHTVDEGSTAFGGLGFQGALVGPPVGSGLAKPTRGHRAAGELRQGAPAGPPKISGGRGAASKIPRTRTP